MTRPTLTATAGAPVSDNQNSITAGRGPARLQDYQLIEKLAHQNRERIPGRVAHAKGEQAAFSPSSIVPAGVAARLGLSAEAVAAE